MYIEEMCMIEIRELTLAELDEIAAAHVHGVDTEARLANIDPVESKSCSSVLLRSLVA